MELTKTKEFQKFQEILTDAKRILITTHELPDGDGLGAEIALYHYLKRGRKAVRIYNPDPLPARYQFLDPKQNTILGPGQVELWDTSDLWIIVDTNDPRRVGKLWGELASRSKKIVFLDHHPDILQAPEPILYPPHAMVLCDTESGSIAEVLYQVFSTLNLCKLNEDVAEGLYISVMTDTNSFRYARTTPRSHRIAAEMIELGVNPETIYQNIFSSKQTSHLQLLGQLLSNTKTAAQGKIAWFEIDLETRKKFRASVDDTLSFMNLLLLLKDAEIVCLFREEEEGFVRLSVKSKGKIVVNKYAMELGGGGHEYAAGAKVKGPLSKAVTGIVAGLENLVTQYERFKK